MKALQFNLLPYRQRQRWQRRGQLAAQLLAAAGLGLCLPRLLWGGSEPEPAAALRQELAQSRRALEQTRARSLLAQQRWQQLQDWRLQRSLLPELLQQLRQAGMSELQLETVAQQGDLLRVQLASRSALPATALLRSLRANPLWAQTEWLGWQHDELQQRITLCLGARTQPRCDDAETLP